MTTSLSNYLSAKKKTYMILIVAALVVYLLVSLTGVRSYFWYTLLFWEAFVLLFLLGQCQLNLCRKKQAVIHEATELVARELEIPCANSRPWDEDQCRSALFFPKQVNAFYLERDIPYQIFTLEKQAGTLQYSHVSVGEMFGSVKKNGKRYVVRGGIRTSVTFKIVSTGLLFRCSLPFPFSESWMFLSRKWGHHLEQITAGNFLTTTLFRKSELPPNFSLFRNENDALWIYSTAGPEQEASTAIREECSFAESCYAPLRGKPYSLMSFTGNTMYVYIPFVWEMASEQKLRESLAEYKADIELVKGIVFGQIMRRHYEKQFAAMNGES